MYGTEGGYNQGFVTSSVVLLRPHFYVVILATWWSNHSQMSKQRQQLYPHAVILIVRVLGPPGFEPAALRSAEWRSIYWANQAAVLVKFT